MFLTGIVIHQVFQALEGEPWGNVIPVVGQAEDPVMLYLPMSHRERVETCREWRVSRRIAHVPTQGWPAEELATTRWRDFLSLVT